MGKEGKRNLTFVILIVLGILLLAFMDIIVLEKVYHPLAQIYNINWDTLNAVIFGIDLGILWWHVAFFTLAFSLFVLLGVAAKSWRLAVSGISLFILGWEDIFYYILQLRWLPSELPWLNNAPMGLSRYLTGTANVTCLGVLISAFIGVIIAGLVLFKYNPLRLFKKG